MWACSRNSIAGGWLNLGSWLGHERKVAASCVLPSFVGSVKIRTDTRIFQPHPAMGNQPGVTRMEPSNIVSQQDSLTSRRRSSETRKERLEVTALKDHQENLLVARDILSDVVNHVATFNEIVDPVCPSRAIPDLQDSEMNRTFTKEDFGAEGLIASPGKDDSEAVQAVTITTLLERDSPVDSIVVDEESPDVSSAESSLNRTIIRKDACGGDCAAPPKSSPSLFDVSATKSELDSSYNTAKESSLSDAEITLFFDAAIAPVKAASYNELLEVDQPPTTDKGQRLSNASHEPFPEASRRSCGDCVVLQSDSDQALSNDPVQLMDFGNATLSSPLSSPQFGNSSGAFLNRTPKLYNKNINFLPSAPTTQPGEEPAVPPVGPTLDSNDNTVVHSSRTLDAALSGTLTPVSEELNQQEIAQLPENEQPQQSQQVVNCVPTLPAGRTELPPAAEEPLDTEAGPEVAQFSEEEFLCAAEFFKDPSDFEFLQKVGSSQRLGKTSLGRCSLFLKFDPLLSEKPASPALCKEEVKPSRRLTEEADKSDKLIDFSPSPKKGQKTPCADLSTKYQEPMFSEKEMSQALKYQELMFQERLLKKDKECAQQLDSVREEADKYRADADKWRAKCEELGQLMLTQDRTLEHVMRQNANLLTAVEMFSKDRKKDGAEKDASQQKVLKERDQLAEDLHNVEIAFADFHRRYEKAKHVISIMKENEAILKKQLAESHETVEKNNQMFNMLKTKTEESLEGANKEMEDTKRSFEADITVLKGQLKKAEMNNNCLEKRLEQKTEENAQLAKLYDDLLGQVKAK